jgi:hypothetical protein
MKVYFFVLLLLTSVIVSGQQTEPAYSIQTHSRLVKLKLNGNTSNWRLAENKRIDLLELALDTAITMQFVSDSDSVKISLGINEEKLLWAILDGRDSFGVKLVGFKYVNSAIFPKQYTRRHNGKVFIEVPEVQELVHIIIALTPTASVNTSLVETGTTYYQEVIKWFGRYSSHAAVQLIDSLLKANQYHNVKMNSCVFTFRRNVITEGGIYDRIAFGKRNIIRPYIKILQDFAMASNFRQFYKNHLPYYNSLVKSQKAFVNTKQMWGWLEREFPDRYNSYKITFSPLVYGNHSTQHFELNGFKETVMFIAPPDTTVGWRKYISGGIKGFAGELERIVFTEIDHNYVNPVSDNYKSVIDSTLSNIGKWATDQALSNYRSAYGVFNEYMTWATFALYLYDHYSKDDFHLINDNMNKLMNDERGFIRFRDFSSKLNELYKNKQGKTIAELYPAIFVWCKEQ